MHRPLGSLEKRFWLLDQKNANHIVLAAEIEGPTSPDDWRRALDSIRNRHPLCSASIQSDDPSTPEFLTDPDAEIPLRVMLDDDNADWTEVVESQLAEAFKTSEAPLLRAVLLHQPDRSVLVLSAHHSMSDGVLLSFLVRDVVKALANVKLDARPMPRSIDDLTMSSLLPSEALKSGLVLRSTVASQLPRRELQEVPSVKRWRMPVDATSKLQIRAKQEGTTIHGALCAALVTAGREISKQWEEATLRVVSPINVREALNVDDDCGLYITSRLVEFEPHATSDFWELARLAKQGLAEAPSFQDVASQSNALKKMFEDHDLESATDILVQRAGRDLMVTNLGRIPFETQMGTLRIATIWGPVALSGHAGERTVGIATTNGSLCVLLASRSPCANLLEEVERILAHACNTA